MTTQGRAHLPSLQSEYWEYSETVSIETPQGKQKRVSSARDRLIRSWREILAKLQKQIRGYLWEKITEKKRFLKKLKRTSEKKEDICVRGGIPKCPHSQWRPIHLPFNTGALSPGSSWASKIKDAWCSRWIQDRLFMEEYLKLYYSISLGIVLSERS